MSNSSCRWETENICRDGMASIKLNCISLLTRREKKKGHQVDWLIIFSRLSRIPKNDYQMFSRHSRAAFFGSIPMPAIRCTDLHPVLGVLSTFPTQIHALLALWNTRTSSQVNPGRYLPVSPFRLSGVWSAWIGCTEF